MTIIIWNISTISTSGHQVFPFYFQKNFENRDVYLNNNVKCISISNLCAFIESLTIEIKRIDKNQEYLSFKTNYFNDQF